MVKRAPFISVRKNSQYSSTLQPYTAPQAYCATGILRHRHTAPQVYYVTDILRHRTYYVTCLEGHVILFLGIYMSFFSSLENLPSRFLLYLIYIYSDISHQNSWQITWPIPGPSYNKLVNVI
jgi:hypothetical protein